MAPTLIFFLKDEAPDIARQVITSGTLLFHVVLEKTAIEDVGMEMGDAKVSSSEISAHPQHPNSALLPPFSSLSEEQRRMSLYFALCTKKHSLLQRIFAIYDSMPNSAKEAVQGYIPILVRTTGASGELLGIISDPPAGSQGLLMQISSVKKLYDTKVKDVEILIPILSSLSKHEIFAVFPQIIDLSPDKFQDALSRILKGSPHSGPVLTPEEVLIAIHGIDPEKDGVVALKKVMDACTSCFEQRQVFTQQVLAKALNQLYKLLFLCRLCALSYRQLGHFLLWMIL